MMRVKGLTGPQVAMDSDAAARRQVHMDDIASGTPRLVARKTPPLDKNGLWLNFTAGCPPLLSVLVAALHLPIVGTWRTRKALGVPYEQGRWPCVFIISRKRYSIHRLYAIP